MPFASSPSISVLQPGRCDAAGGPQATSKQRPTTSPSSSQKPSHHAVNPFLTSHFPTSKRHQHANPSRSGRPSAQPPIAAATQWTVREKYYYPSARPITKWECDVTAPPPHRIFTASLGSVFVEACPFWDISRRGAYGQLCRRFEEGRSARRLPLPAQHPMCKVNIPFEPLTSRLNLCTMHFLSIPAGSPCLSAIKTEHTRTHLGASCGLPHKSIRSVPAAAGRLLSRTQAFGHA